MSADSEVESQADRFYRNLSQRQSGKPKFITSEDPIGIYNHVVKQFNAKCNRVSEGTFEGIDNNCFYGLWMKRFWTLLEADTHALYMIFSFFITFILGLIPFINIFVIVVWLVVWFIYERIFKAHRANRQLCDDPFKYMIYAPEVCKRAKLMNVYFDVPTQDLVAIGLRESQVSFLRQRQTEGRVLFMVYNDRFKSAYTKFSFLRVFHIIQVLLALTAILLANLAIYPKMGINEFLL
ncbi:unnamed protein product [Blepharisma stoltei]|uniref:Autophagy-related protein 9 n=1 Tax=Blepharisma stoltei TaxID=1481888 RepID=A0AAU9IIK7_9CILI|nr:unnamed protein product [Blepharisma stoltei]